MIARADFDQWRARDVARLLALVEGERRYYQELIALLPVPLAVVSPAGFVLSANPAFRRLTGASAGASSEDTRRLRIDQLLPIPGLLPGIQKAQASPVPAFTAQAELAGVTRAVRISLAPIRNWTGENEIEILLIAEDLPAAQPASTQPSSVPAHLPGVVWQAEPGPAGTVRFHSVHGAAEELTGFPAAHWTTHAEFFEQRIHPEDRERVLAAYQQVIHERGDASAEFRLASANGAFTWVRETIRAAGGGVTGLLTSIHRRQELESGLLASSRMDALRRLSGQLAHDLNNPLMIVQGYAEELFESLPKEDPRRYDINEILKATQRISALTSQLLQLGRQSPKKTARPPVPVDLGPVLASVHQRLLQTMGPAVSSTEGRTVEVTPPDPALWASADPEQLSDILISLAGSRREWDQRSSPQMTQFRVTCYAETISESIPGATLSPGRYACISLQDDGRLPDPSERAALFESVLEKDPVLSSAYATVREWGGDISGNFTIYLPRAASPAGTTPSPAPAAVQPPAAAPDRETILVVDDEPGIRSLIVRILQRDGYNVLEAPTAEAALAVSRSHTGVLHLLLTDISMPGLSGLELAQQLWFAHQNLKVLFISGHTDEERISPAPLDPGFGFLPKPFTVASLSAKVRELLDS